MKHRAGALPRVTRDSARGTLRVTRDSAGGSPACAPPAESRVTQGLPRAFRERSRGLPRAFSLLEVILSLAILAGAVAVLGQLTRGGLENARLARDLTLAQLYCESKMAEIAAGLAPLESQQGVPFEDTDDPSVLDWIFTVEVVPTAQTGLLEVCVTVSQDPSMESQPVEYKLVRWIRDPEADAAAMGEEL